MKKLPLIDSGLALLLLCFFVTSACVPVTKNVIWETIPEFNVSEDEGWNALVDSILSNFDGFAISDKNAGYIKTTWKTTDHCWAGYMFGGSVPCKKVRASAKVISRTPFKVKISVEAQKANPWTHYGSWTVVGNDEAMEREIIDDLQMTLASLAKPTVTVYQEKGQFPLAEKPVIAKTLDLDYLEKESEISTTSFHWALVIGLSDYYDSRVPSLRYAEKDARAFYDWLVSTSGGRYTPSRVKLMIGKEATGRNIKDALFNWLGQALEEDIVTIYFAGHGTSQSPDQPDNLFLLPHDAQYDNIAATGFPMWDIETLFRRFIKAKRVVVIADACHAGGIGEAFAIARRSNRAIQVNSISSGLGNLSKVGDGVCVISASDDKQFSQESRDWGGGHGVFTYFLLKGPEGEADYNRDASVTLGELIPYLSEQVRRATRNVQSPTVAGRFDPALTIGR